MNFAPLIALQSEVERHFEELAVERLATGLPVFAIEHGLTKGQVDDIALGLRRHIALGGQLSTLWLLYVLYATELGYDFDGDEYWQSFESKTPQWKDVPRRREQLRSFFERFTLKYVGTVPTGLWAKHFSIISLPITHAILPLDLQSQMARTLFDSRHEIAEAANRPPRLLGQLLARRADGVSSRFRNFMEQEELTGRIAKALLFPGDDDVGTVLLPATLQRIVSDLEASWEAKSWLKEARKVANEVRLRLLAKRSADVLLNRSSDTREAREAVEAKCVAPKVILRRVKEGVWNGYVEIPSFAGWAKTNPKVASFLARFRCKVRGTDDIWHARRWLLYGAQQKRLLELPKAGMSWIRFEEWEEETVRLVDEECRVAQRPWLFRIDDDGCAYQIVGKSVRPGSKYIILHTEELAVNECLTQVEIDTKGCFAHLLCVPSQATETSVRCLSLLGLSATRVLKVWSAGLPALGYDGEALLEWSARLPLVLGVEHDETCENFKLQVDGSGTVFLTDGRKTSYVELGVLRPGLHHITVSASYRATDGRSQLRTQASQCSFSVAVRSSVSGLPSRRHAPVIAVATDPHSPNLDAMMTGLASCTVHGPRGRTVDFSLELLNGSGEAIHTEFLGTLPLPVDQIAWKELIQRRGATDSVGEAYFKASAGRLIVDAQELGKARVSLKHLLSPIRWHVSRSHKTICLTLVDDTDHAVPVSAYRASFQHPTQTSSCWDSSRPGDVAIEGDGGLYVATVNGYRSAVVVNAPPTKMSLEDWKHSAPTLVEHLSNGQEVAQLLCWIRDWTDARLIGPLAGNRRNTVLREMHRQLYATMCDTPWATTELVYIDSGDSKVGRAALESRVWKKNPAFAIGLSRDAEAIITSSLEETSHNFLQHVGPYSICSDRRLCELALRLAVTPHTFADWAGKEAANRLDSIVNEKAVMRAARLLALLLGERGRLLAQNW